MITAFNLAGFFAAHTIWSIADGAELTPIFAYTNEYCEKAMNRLVVGDDVEESVNCGKELIDSNKSGATDAVLLYDGRISTNGEKFDAIIAEIRCYFSPWSRAVLAIPYKPAASGDFRVYKPRLLQWEDCDDFNCDAAVQSFFAGVDAHEKGAAVWNQAREQSI